MLRPQCGERTWTCCSTSGPPKSWSSTTPRSIRVTGKGRLEEGRQYLVSPELCALQRGGLRCPPDAAYQRAYPATMYG